MTLQEILGTIGGGGVLIVLLGLIKVKPLEISVWSWLFRKIGKAFNGETLDYVKSIQASLDEHLQQHEQEKAETNRQRILRFADEVYDKKHHSKESFDNIREIIKEYDKYCEAYPDFPNSQTEMASKIINDTYLECFKEHKFHEGEEHEGT